MKPTLTMALLWFFVSVAVGCSQAKKRSQPRTGSSEAETPSESEIGDHEARRRRDVLPKIEEAVSSLAAKHGAVPDWSKSIIPRGSFECIYTVDLQDALVSDDRKAVIFLASLLDVSREKSGYLARFYSHHISTTHSGDFEFGMDFALTCSPAVAKRLLSPGKHGGLPSMDVARRLRRLHHRFEDHPEDERLFDETDFVVVALVSDVRRPAFSVSASVAEQGGLGPQADLELDSGHTFLAHGECLDIVALEDLIER